MRITTYLPEPLLPRLYAFTFYNERTDFVCVCVCVDALYKRTQYPIERLRGEERLQGLKKKREKRIRISCEPFKTVKSKVSIGFSLDFST